MWITKYTQAGVLAVLVSLSLFFDWGNTTIAEQSLLQHIASGKMPVAKNESFASEVVSVVVQLSGGMGNNVLRMANGICIKHAIENELGLRADIILRAQEQSKWKFAMLAMKAVFPKTRRLNFREGNSKEFGLARKQQAEWLSQLKSAKKVDLTNITIPKVLEKTCKFERCHRDLIQLLNQTWYLDRPSIPLDSNFSIPHIYADTMADAYCWDVMYDELKAFFKVDTERICKKIPEPDETVFHYRNFATEIPKVAITGGFEEMGPNMTANSLFKNYTSGEKVAIVSRFRQNAGPYLRALKDIKGIKAHYVNRQTAEQDFCYLLKAKKELVGGKRSTFALVAGYLGDAKRARLYSWNTRARRAKGVHYYAYTFENKQLRDRLVFENYDSAGHIVQ
eukprot:scaffold1786_cov138-Cylindrotheca_fusiformis.AAC.9